MHSAEHMLNQTMVRMFNCGRCISAHVEKRKSRLDFHLSRDLTEEEKKKIEHTMNELIQQDLKVTEDFIGRTEAEKQFNLTRLPEDAGDRIRIIRIGEYDACPCSGEHVRSTREIGEFHIISTTYENGNLRLRFKLLETGERPPLP